MSLRKLESSNCLHPCSPRTCWPCLSLLVLKNSRWSRFCPDFFVLSALTAPGSLQIVATLPWIEIYQHRSVQIAFRWVSSLLSLCWQWFTMKIKEYSVYLFSLKHCCCLFYFDDICFCLAIFLLTKLLVQACQTTDYWTLVIIIIIIIIIILLLLLSW